MLKLAHRERITSYFYERFGIPPERFNGFSFFETGRSVWMLSDSPNNEIVTKALEMKRIEFPGLRILRKVGRWLKPTTYGLQLVGDSASRHLKELSRKELSELLRRGYLEITEHNWEEGYIIALYDSTVIGCLLYRNGRLKHQFPRGRVEALSRSGLY